MPKKIEPKKLATPSIKKTADPAGKKEVLDNIVKEINKKHGDNAITIGFPKPVTKTGIARIPTGSLSLDIDLGGGIPVGRFTEISGAETSTKTTQSLHILREAQKMGKKCAFMDVEGTTDEQYAASLGIDMSDIYYSQPDGTEEATQILIELQRSGKIDFAILDSLAAMAPTKELESDMDETVRMGIQQQLLGEYFRKYQAANNRLNREGKPPFTLIAINQLREKIGAYGDAEYTPGGRAKGFAASIGLRLRRGDWIRKAGADSEIVGQVVKYKVTKNKTAQYMRTGEFDFYFAENPMGVKVGYNDNCKEIIIAGVEWGVIERSGAWFTCLGKQYQGVKALTDGLRDNEKAIAILKSQVMDIVKKVNK